MDKVKDLDLYELLEVDFGVDEAQIKKAYRKKALKCHPDKNPDDPKAVALFHQLSNALSVLVDPEARKAYDNVLKARKAAKIRHKQLDAKRQKLKEDLEQREKASKEFELINRQRTDEEKLAREIERLQKEGKRQLEEEQERVRKLLEEERARPGAASATFNGPTKVKVRWSGGNYDKEILKRIFAKFGDVSEVVVLPSKKGGGSGLVEMATKQSAIDAATIEKGFDDNPLKIKLLEGTDGCKTTTASCVPATFAATNAATQDFNDFETLVMRQMRQQEERKRLIAEMMKQEDNE